MPRSTHGARPIVIDCRRLYWKAGKPSPPNVEHSVCQLTVFAISGGTSRLIAATSSYDPISPHFESRFTPRWIEAIIRRAFDCGWDPDSRGPDHRLQCDYADVILELEGLPTTEYWADRRPDHKKS